VTGSPSIAREKGEREKGGESEAGQPEELCVFHLAWFVSFFLDIGLLVCIYLEETWA
jgi:hypothetical protein